MGRPRTKDIDGVPLCKNGHKVEGDNVYLWTSSTGKVYEGCRLCNREANKDNQQGRTTRTRIQRRNIYISRLIDDITTSIQPEFVRYAGENSPILLLKLRTTVRKSLQTIRVTALD